MPLLESRAPADPLLLFRRWFREAQRKGSPQAAASGLDDVLSLAPAPRAALRPGLAPEPGGHFARGPGEGGRGARPAVSENGAAALGLGWLCPAARLDRVLGAPRRSPPRPPPVRPEAGTRLAIGAP